MRRGKTGFIERLQYFDGRKMHVVRPYPPICQPGYITVVVQAPNATHRAGTRIPTAAGDRFFSELLSMSLSCGAAAISWVVVAGSGAVVPITGGSSGVVTILSYGGASASSLQCVNSVVRMASETDYGSAETNRWLDSQEWYIHTMTALDVISIAGAGAAAGATVKMVLRLNKPEPHSRRC